MTANAPTPTPRTGDRAPQDGPLRTPRRFGAVLALVGVAVALLSLFLPWLADADRTFSPMELSEIIEIKGIAPLLFFGLGGVTLWVVLSLMTRLGVFAILAAVASGIVLVAHVVLIVVLFVSLGQDEPLLSGLPMGTSVTYGVFIAALGLALAVGGSVWAVTVAEHRMPDRWHDVAERERHATETGDQQSISR